MSLSIIVPVHNTEQYLAECLDSVLSEINTDDEVILVENGSTDRSWEICQVFAEKYNTVIGEIIDVDAYTGGFNLQIAFSTGYVAGQLL